MSLQADIQVRYVNQAKPGKKLGNIADTGQNRWLVPAEFVDLFHVGDQCSITYERQTWGDNPNLVTAKNGILLADLAAGKHSSSPMKTHVPPAAQPDHAAKERGMFIVGVVGRAMGSGQFGPNDVKALTYAADEAWREVVEGNAAPHVSQPVPGVQPPQYDQTPAQASGMNDGPPSGDPRFADRPF